MTKMKPVNGKVIVRPISDSGRNGSIVIPDAHRDAPTEGIVERISDVTVQEIRIGTRVIYNRFAGTDVQYGRSMLKLLDQNDILATIE